MCPIVVFSRSVCSYTLAATVFASQIYVLSRLFALLGQQIKGKLEISIQLLNVLSTVLVGSVIFHRIARCNQAHFGESRKKPRESRMWTKWKFEDNMAVAVLMEIVFGGLTEGSYIDNAKRK